MAASPVQRLLESQKILTSPDHKWAKPATASRSRSADANWGVLNRMSVTKVKKTRLRGLAWALLFCLGILPGAPVTLADAREQSGDKEDIHEFLRETFQGFLYHGAYLDKNNDYLVISLKIDPGELAGSLGKGPFTIDEILAHRLIDNLYKKRFSFYLLGLPQIKGVSVILTWEGCQRVRGPEGDEKILLKEGISEFDRFEVGRTLYFDKIGLVEVAADPFSAGKLFDRIEFSHRRGDSYKESYLHIISEKP